MAGVWPIEVFTTIKFNHRQTDTARYTSGSHFQLMTQITMVN